MEQRVSAIGHTHVASYFSRTDGAMAGGPAGAGTELNIAAGEWLLNPGSVGQPRDGDPRAAWLLLDVEQWTATWRRTEYPVHEAATGNRGRRATRRPGRTALLGAMTRHRRHLLAACAACALAVAGCGSSDEPEGAKLPQASVAQLNQRLDEIQRRYDDARDNQNPGRLRGHPERLVPGGQEAPGRAARGRGRQAARRHRGELRPPAAADRRGLPGHPAHRDGDHAHRNRAARDGAAGDHPDRDHPAGDDAAEKTTPERTTPPENQGGNGGTDPDGTGGGGVQAPEGDG